MKRFWRVVLITGAAFAIPAAINAAIARGRRDVKTVLPGEAGEYAWPMAPIFYQVRGEGQPGSPPIVLVHGIGAGSSSFEWRHNFDALAADFRVYALDLPGFGRSAHPNLTYSADLYVLALVDFLRDIVREPAHLVASSLSAAYAVRVAALRPELVRTLTLTCPTGMEALRAPVSPLGSTTFGVFSLPAIGDALYNGIASYTYIEKYLREQVYADSLHVTPALVEHYYQSAHQPNSQYALRSFLSGLLNLDIRTDWSHLSQPALIVWGRHARPTPVEQAQAFVRANPTAHLRIFEHSGLLPHDEEHEDFNDALLTFLTLQAGSIAARSTPSLLRNTSASFDTTAGTPLDAHREVVPEAPAPDNPISLTG